MSERVGRDGRAVRAAEWARTKTAQANLRLTRRRLEHVGSEDPFVLMGRVPIERVQSMHGIGPVTASSLRRAGYHRAADLWNEQKDNVRTPYAENVGDARTAPIAEWVLRVRARCVKNAAADARKRSALQLRQVRLVELLAAPPENRPPMQLARTLKQSPARARDWLKDVTSRSAKSELPSTEADTSTSTGSKRRRNSVSRARTTPEERRHRYVRDEDWQARAYAWKKSAELRSLFNDSFTRYEMTARDERRIRESRGGPERIRRTWQILESFGITIEVPPTGPSGKRREPVHFTLPSPTPE